MQQLGNLLGGSHIVKAFGIWLVADKIYEVFYLKNLWYKAL